MKTKNCPVCDGVAGRYKKGSRHLTGKLTCFDNDCPIAELEATDEAWNALPRPKPTPHQRPEGGQGMSLKDWIDEIAIFGWQRSSRAFGYYFGVCVWPGQPPCKGKLFGCWHIEGEPGWENYEASFPLTKTWTVHLSATKEPK